MAMRQAMMKTKEALEVTVQQKKEAVKQAKVAETEVKASKLILYDTLIWFDFNQNFVRSLVYIIAV